MTTKSRRLTVSQTSIYIYIYIYIYTVASGVDPPISLSLLFTMVYNMCLTVYIHVKVIAVKTEVKDLTNSLVYTCSYILSP